MLRSSDLNDVDSSSQYTISFEIRANKAGSLGVYSYFNGANVVNSPINVNTLWQRFEFTPTAKPLGTSVSGIEHLFGIRASTPDWAVNDWYEVRHVQQQKGTKGTSFSKSTAAIIADTEANAKAIQTTNAEVERVDGRVTSSAQTTSLLQAKLDGIVIGGTNLIKGSDSFRLGSAVTGLTRELLPNGSLKLTGAGGTYHSWASAATEASNLGLALGDKFTVTMWLKAVDVAALPTIMPYLYIAGYDAAYRNNFNVIGDLSKGNAVRYVQTRTVTSTSVLGELGIAHAHWYIGSLGGGLILERWQIEAGSQSTDWSPSIAETQDKFNATAEAISNTNVEVKRVGDKVTTEASRLDSISTKQGEHTATLTQQSLVIDGVKAQHTVTLDVNGLVSGTQSINNGKTSSYAINADYFYVGSPVTGKRPFMIRTTPLTVGDVTYPVGTWIDAAFIADATITSAKIGKLTANKITVGNASSYEAGYDPATNLQVAKDYADVDLYNGGVVLNQPFGLRNAVASAAGSFVITTPLTTSALMTQMDISGYLYTSGVETIFKITLSFYAYMAATPFYNYRASCSGVLLSGISLGLDANKKVVIIINKGGTWSYPFITVDKVTIGNGSASLKNGWSGAFVTDTSIYTDQVPVPIDQAETVAGATSKVQVIASQISDIAADNKLTAVEKKNVKLMWSDIQKEYSELTTRATQVGLAYPTVTSTYNTLNTYITPLLANVNITSDIVRSTFETNFAAFKTAATDLEKTIQIWVINTAVNTVVVGGRNYLLNSIDGGSKYLSSDFNLAALNSSSVTISFDIDMTTAATAVLAGKDRIGFEFNYVGTDGVSRWIGAWCTNVFSKGKFKTRVSVTTSVINAPANASITLLAYYYQVTGGACTISNVQLEAGNKASSWTAAPEDVIKYVDNIDIGGVNLLYRSYDYTLWTLYGTAVPVVSSSNYQSSEALRITSTTFETTGGSDVLKVYRQANNLVVGRRITVSCIITNRGTTELSLDLLGIGSPLPISVPAGTVKATITLQGTLNLTYAQFRIKTAAIADAMKVDVFDLKFEYGDKATSWSPSPMDIDASISDIRIGGTNLFPMSLVKKGYNLSGTGILSALTTTNHVTYDEFQLTGSNSNLMYQVWNDAGVSSSNTNRVCFYTSAKVFISAVTIPTLVASAPYYGLKIPIPANAAYVKLGAIAGTSSFDAGIRIKFEFGDNFSDWSLAPEDQKNNLETYVKNNTGNLLNNTTLSGTVDKWSTGTVSNLDFLGTTVALHTLTTSGDAEATSDTFEVDPSKAYEVSGWFKCGSAVGSLYLGLHAYDKAGANIGVNAISRASGVDSTAANKNFYYYNVSGGGLPLGWVKLVGYIMPAGTTSTDMKNIGAVVTANARMLPNTAKMAVRWLNYYNSGTSTTKWAANLKCVEVDPNAIIAALAANGLAETKAQTFTAVPTIPYSKGDIWKEGTTIKVSNVTRSSGSYTPSDWVLVGDVTGENTSANSNQLGGTAAATVVNNASKGLEVYNDVMSDLKITPVEKTAISQEWNRIQAEYSQYLAQATSLGLSTTAYSSAYTALATTDPAMSTILSSMTTTTTLTAAQRDAYKSQYTTYYTRVAELVKAINEKIAINAEAAADAAVDSLIIGGKNYLLNSVSGNNSKNFSPSWDLIAFAGQSVVISFDIEMKTAATAALNNRIGFEFNYVDTDGTTRYVGAWCTNVFARGLFKERVSKTIQLNNLPSSTAVNVLPYHYQVTGGTCVISNVKLEIGTKATDWSPAPEDLTKTFMSTPTVPYSIGDMWKNGSAVYICNTSQASNGTYNISHWTLVGDVTSQNTSANTVKVGNTTAAVIEVNSLAGANISADILSDLVITSVEKTALYNEWNRIKAEYTNQLSQANSLSISTTAYTNVYNAINGTAPTMTSILASMVTKTTLTTTERDNFRTQMNNYYLQATAISKSITQAVITKAEGEVGAVLSKVNDMSADNVLTPLEKQQSRTIWFEITNEHTNIVNKATSLSVSSTAYVNAYTTLSNYLTTLFTSMNANSSIDRATFNTNFVNVYSQRSTLQKNIDDADTQLAITTSKSYIDITPIPGGKIFNRPAALRAAVINNTTPFVIRTPLTLVNYMTSLEISGYNYTATVGNSYTISLGFYACIPGTPFINYRANVQGINLTSIELALDVNNKVVIIITPSNALSYPYISLDSAVVMAAAAPDSFSTQFSIALDGTSVFTSRTNVPMDKYETEAGAQAKAGAVQTVVDQFSTDSILSSPEKKQVKIMWEEIAKEQPTYLLNATALSLSTTAYVASYNTLNTYITPLLANLNINTTIVRATFQTNFSVYYDERTKLIKAINDTLKTIGDNAKIVADSKSRTYITQPTTPYTIGDIYKNGASTYISTVTRASGAYVAADWTLVGDVTGSNTSANSLQLGGTAASTVLDNASKGLTVYNDVMSDLKVTPVEKTALNTEWVRIQAEYTSMLAHATALTVSTTTFTTAYNALNSTAPTMTSIIGSMTTTTTLTAAQRDALRTQFTNYYAQVTALNKAISDKVAANAKVQSDAKAKTFTATPVTPYSTGDLWRNGSAMYVCTTSRSSGSYTAGDWTLVGDVTSNNTAADTAKVNGINAATVASNAANGAAVYADVMSDLKITPVEKTAINQEWNRIQKEYASLLAQAQALSITTTAYTAAYTGLSTTAPAMSTILASMSTTTTLTAAERDAYKTQYTTYYTQTANIVKEINNKIAVNAKAQADAKSKTFTAQPVIPYTVGDLWQDGTTIKVCTVTRASGSYTAADWTLVGDVTSANTAANSLQLGGIAAATVTANAQAGKTLSDNVMSDLIITPVEKSGLLNEWNRIKSEYTNLNSQAVSLGVPATALTTAYTALNASAPRIETDILASMVTNYTLTVATRDNFKTKLNAYFVQAMAMSKALTDKVQSNAAAADSKADSANNQVNSWKFTGTTEIDGGKIRADTVTATQINVADLSAISATIGTLRTRTSGSRLEIRDDIIEVFDANGIVRVQLGIFNWRN